MERVGWAAVAALLIVLALFGSLGSNTTPTYAAALDADEAVDDERPTAIVIDSRGSVSVIRNRGTADERVMSPVKAGLLLFRGDQIWTGEDSWIEVEFEETARVRVGPSSRVEVVTGLLREVDPETGRELPTMRLWVGRIWVHVAEALSRLRNFSVETPSAIAGVRGTLFAVDVGVTGKTIVSVREGVVAVSSPSALRNEYLVGKDEEIEVFPQQEPSGSTKLGADESRRWDEMQPWLKEQFEWKATRRQKAQGGLFGFLSRMFRADAQTAGAAGWESSGGRSTDGRKERHGDGSNSRHRDEPLKLPSPVLQPSPVPVLPQLLSFSEADPSSDSMPDPHSHEPADRDEDDGVGGEDGRSGRRARLGRGAGVRPASSGGRSGGGDRSAGADDRFRSRMADADRGAGPGGREKDAGADRSVSSENGRGQDAGPAREDAGGAAGQGPENRGRAPAPGQQKKASGGQSGDNGPDQDSGVTGSGAS